MLVEFFVKKIGSNPILQLVNKKQEEILEKSRRIDADYFIKRKKEGGGIGENHALINREEGNNISRKKLE